MFTWLCVLLLSRRGNWRTGCGDWGIWGALAMDSLPWENEGLVDERQRFIARVSEGDEVWWIGTRRRLLARLCTVVYDEIKGTGNNMQSESERWISMRPARFVPLHRCWDGCSGIWSVVDWRRVIESGIGMRWYMNARSWSWDRVNMATTSANRKWTSCHSSVQSFS